MFGNACNFLMEGTLGLQQSGMRRGCCFYFAASEWGTLLGLIPKWLFGCGSNFFVCFVFNKKREGTKHKY